MNKTVGKVLAGVAIVMAGIGLAIKTREPKEVLEIEEVGVQEESL